MTEPTRIRVLQIIPTLDQSGAEKQLYLLAKHLPRDRYDVHVVCLTRGGPYAKLLEEAGIPVTVLGKRFKIDPWIVSRLSKLIKELKPDIVQTWLFAANSYGRAAALLSKSPIVIATERCVDSWKRRYQLAIDRWFAKRTDCVVANSQAVGGFYLKHGIPREKIRVIRNAIEPIKPSDLVSSEAARPSAIVSISNHVPNAGDNNQPPTFSGQGVGQRSSSIKIEDPADGDSMVAPHLALEVPNEQTEQPSDLRSRLGIPRDHFVLGFVGRLWPQKRVQDLIWATDILRIADVPIHTVIVGDGPSRPSLEGFMHGLELEQRVHFVGHQKKPLAWIDMLDVFVLPSKFEGMPNVVLEAMALKKAVVATRIPGLDEVVVDGETGFLVEPKKPFEIAKVLLKLYEQPELRAKFGEAGFARVAELFAMPRMVQSYADLYEDLLRTKRQRQSVRR